MGLDKRSERHAVGRCKAPGGYLHGIRWTCWRGRAGEDIPLTGTALPGWMDGQEGGTSGLGHPCWGNQTIDFQESNLKCCVPKPLAPMRVVIQSLLPKTLLQAPRQKQKASGV
eukprot:356891-Chlamydomonas_euryale.AAC.7